MRHVLGGWCASALWSIAIALALPSPAAAQEPVGCPSWNLHYGSPEDAAKAYYESPGFVSSVGASCVPVKDIFCGVSAPKESRYDCTARLKTATGCHQNVIPTMVEGSGPPIVGNDYITFGNSDGRTWCGRWPPYAGKNPGPPDCPHCPGQTASNPVNVATGNKYQVEVDYPSAGDGHLEFVRYYNSELPYRDGMGRQWRHTWQRSLQKMGMSTMFAYRPDGKYYKLGFPRYFGHL